MSPVAFLRQSLFALQHFPETFQSAVTQEFSLAAMIRVPLIPAEYTGGPNAVLQGIIFHLGHVALKSLARARPEVVPDAASSSVSSCRGAASTNQFHCGSAGMCLTFNSTLHCISKTCRVSSSQSLSLLENIWSAAAGATRQTPCSISYSSCPGPQPV